MSHRSAETGDVTIADISVAIVTMLIKIGTTLR
ncbi:MAG: hypothetical protein O8C64_02840 [Candidatus Methanoperedens sp.]|nr:hypothetical protein [Candidatus Methanoperedens sp.]MCZ7406495.1 hypothetical protein [Candidatus Methanoperedens sp.]